MTDDMPCYYITDDQGQKIRNPAHVEYMRQKFSNDREKEEEEEDKAVVEDFSRQVERLSMVASTIDISEIEDPDDDPMPKKYIKNSVGKLVRNPEYDAYMKGTPALSKTSTALDSVVDIVDLSRDFQIQGDKRSLENNPGARWCKREFSKFREVRSVTVIENGKLVADYRQKGVGPDDTHNLFSTTKSVTSMLIGAVMERHELSPSDTLGDIFPGPWPWQHLSGEELEYKKSIRLEEILTMTSGLKSMLGGRKGILSMKELSVADAPGSDLPRALAAPQWDPNLRGKFNYMPSSNILSYVIKEKTGLSPREFGDKFVFPKLGILHDKMKWDANANGIETSYSQLKLTTHQMCKIGQLYLQDGYDSPRSLKPIISEEWIRASHSKHVFGSAGFDHWYGYLWALYDRDYHGNRQAGDIWVAPGFNGQMIGICRETNRVCAVSRLPVPMDAKSLVKYKKMTIKLLSKTMKYQSFSDRFGKNVPKKFIKNSSGLMIRNPDYDLFMADEVNISEGINDMETGRIATAKPGLSI